MKKVLAVILIIFLAISISLIAVGCKDKVETFNGALSEQSYDTEQDAVIGFLALEICGNARTATLLEYTKESELSRKQIKKLNTNELLKDGDEILSAQVIKVKYTTRVSKISALPDENDYSVFTIYIIEISSSGKAEHEFRYYVPKAVDGDILTKSYYEYVFNSDKYKNCTQEYDTSIWIEANNKARRLEIDYTITVDYDKVFLYMETIIRPYNFGYISDIQTNLAYFEYSNGKVKTWLSEDKGKTYKRFYGTSSTPNIEDFDSFTNFSEVELDHSYYEKTDFGFTIQSKNIGEYITNLFSEMGLPLTNVNARLDFYINNDRIEEIVTMTDGSYQGISYSVNQKVKLSNFGSTTVTKPETIID